MDNVIWLFGKPIEKKKPKRGKSSRVLSEALSQADCLESVLIIAYRKNGDLVYLTNEQSLAEIVLMTEHFKIEMMRTDD